MKKRTIAIIIIILLFLFSAWLNLHMYESLKTKDQSFAALQDSLHISRNKLGEQTATLSVVQLSHKQLQMISDSMYNRIKAIERKQRRRLLTVVTINETTKDTVSGKPTIIAKDTVKNGNITEVYPIYVDTLEKKYNGKVFATYNLYMSKDSSNVVADIKNSTDITFRYGKTEKENFFDRKHLLVDVKNYNPNTGVSNMKSYAPPTKKKTHLELIVGAVAGALGMFFLMH